MTEQNCLCMLDLAVAYLKSFISRILSTMLKHPLQHLFKTLHSTADVYLDELRLELEEKHGVSVAMSTIWRTLVKGGYSMKKVCSKPIRLSIYNRLARCLCNRLQNLAPSQTQWHWVTLVATKKTVLFVCLSRAASLFCSSSHLLASLFWI